MSVATVSRKDPFALFASGLSSHLLHSGHTDWTKLWAALCVFKANAAGFCVKPVPGQRKDFATAASAQQQRADGSYTSAILAVGGCLTHCSTEGGELFERQKASALVVGKTTDTARRVVGHHAVPFGKFEDRAQHSNSPGCDTPTAGSPPAAAFFLTRPGGLARRYVCLKPLDVAARKPGNRAPADEWFNVAFNPAAIHCQRGWLNTSLGVRHV